ncbi:alpha/beta fold hydrolase [Parendozoicomonas haliclonae]|uniref:Lipase 1 n=1 Tax=Parendozoicomonas haliclonae TaxID=1960125 RepID=A0A1X7ALB2_9GAMM|nr:alpha/beta fold hydrolase [Parendozoicomonas haliclonae]SMA45622.1 Lipase 1 precursor [Parendozoicomonas haliclonae]
MITATAFLIWAYLLPALNELPHTIYDRGQDLGAWMYGFNSREVMADGCLTRYLERGEGPTLLMLHGVGVSKEVWLLMAPYLRNYRLIIPDLPGHGQSCRDLERNYRLEGMTQWLEAFSSGLHLGSVHIAAHSVGASIAGWYAAGLPEQVQTLTAIAPAGIEQVPADIKKLSPFMHELVTTGENQLLAKDVTDFSRVMNMGVEKQPWPWMVWFGYRLLAWEYLRNQEYTDRAIQGMLETREDLQSGKINSTGLFSDITMPTQVIWGERDAVMDVAGADVIESYRADIPVHRLPGIGHGPMLEDARQSAELLDDFIQAYLYPAPEGSNDQEDD